MTVKPLSSTILPYTDSESGSVYLVQMFVSYEDTSKLMEEIRYLPCVLSAEVKTSPHMQIGWGVDLFFFPPTIGGKLRLFCIIGPYFIEGVSKLKDMLGATAESFLYYLGYSYGVKMAEG